MPTSELPLVLVVDDDPDLRKLISEFLANHGFRVATAESSVDVHTVVPSVGRMRDAANLAPDEPSPFKSLRT